MRIAQVVPLQIAVPPNKYGGTERVVANLTEALVKLGHDVTLFATADSTTSATLEPMLDREIFFNPEIDATAHHVAMLHEIYTRRAGDFDVIHSHLDYLTLPFTHLTSTPTVLTLHGRLDRPEWNRAFRQYPEANYVSISDDQRKPLPDLNWVSTVHHGIDVDSFKPSYKQGDYLCFVGRMSHEKRPDLAIEVAKRTGMKLKIAAKVDHKEEPYFKSEIEPLLDHPLIEWLGEVDEERKRELMAGAYALILPIDWPEPFGMVFIEALACGTPVVSLPARLRPRDPQGRPHRLLWLHRGRTGGGRAQDQAHLAPRLPRLRQAPLRHAPHGVRVLKRLRESARAGQPLSGARTLHHRSGR